MGHTHNHLNNNNNNDNNNNVQVRDDGNDVVVVFVDDDDDDDNEGLPILSPVQGPLGLYQHLCEVRDYIDPEVMWAAFGPQSDTKDFYLLFKVCGV